MNEQKNVSLVQEAYAAFGRGDIDAILGLLSDDIDWHFLGDHDLPTAGQRKGKNEVRRFFKEVGETWNFERFEPRHFIAQGDEVVVLGYYGGTAKGTGRPFGTEWAQVFNIRDGKAFKFREYADTANLVRAWSKATAKV